MLLFMKKRSVKLTIQGKKLAENSLAKKNLTKRALAQKLQICEATIYKFFKPINIDKEYFAKICKLLELDAEKVIDLIESAKNTAIVVRKKNKNYLREQYGNIKVLDMSFPICLNQLYTKVNILEKITARNRKTINELTQQYCERFGLDNKVIEKKVPALEVIAKNNRLIIWGKPGAGKTTFLKHLIIQCISGEFLNDLVPIFISLKEFGELENNLSLINYIVQELNVDDITEDDVIILLKSGKLLILLDGLDEIKKQDTSRVIKEIRDLSYQFVNNKFVITCRIAAREYTFENFTEVEIADFDREQIESLATNWFNAKNLPLTQIFLKKLNNCPAIQELATNPLLLTLLCLEFEESADFPSERAELYKRAINTLLRKWDAKRGIQRDIVYKQLSLQRKEILLTEIAFKTLKQGNYFLKQSLLENLITDYIQNLPDAKTEFEALRTDSEVVLKSIEAQHGLLLERATSIYSFSHLTFQEYFTASYIVEHCNNKNINDPILGDLVWHIFDKKWREVFLLTSEMIANADTLLLRMKYAIDLFANNSKTMQKLLAWANQKASDISSTEYSKLAVRTFYLCLAAGVYILDISNPPFSFSFYWNITDISNLLETIEPNLQLNFYIGHGSGFGFGNFKGSINDKNLALDFNLSHARCHFSLLGRIANGEREYKE